VWTQYYLKKYFMKVTIKKCNLKNTSIPLFEDFFYNTSLNFITKFNTTSLTLPTILNISLNFGFKEINFEKKTNDIIFFFIRIVNKSKM